VHHAKLTARPLSPRDARHCKRRMGGRCVQLSARRGRAFLRACAPSREPVPGQVGGGESESWKVGIRARDSAADSATSAHVVLDPQAVVHFAVARSAARTNSRGADSCLEGAEAAADKAARARRLRWAGRWPAPVAHTNLEYKPCHRRLAWMPDSRALSPRDARHRKRRMGGRCVQLSARRGRAFLRACAPSREPVPGQVAVGESESSS
jgi:hypothetical protein